MKRFFVSVILATLCLAGSSYIVLESAGYYQKLYILADLPGEMGWYTAILSEAFQFMLVILLPTRKENRIRWHALLVIIVLIYTITIFSAGMNVGKPFIEKWNRSKTNDKLYSILLEEQKALNGQIKLLHDQKQKLNTVISIKAGRHSFQEIKNHLKKELPVDSTLIQVELAALWLLRILIQLANLFCSRMIALNWKTKTVREAPIQGRATLKTRVVRKWKAKYTREESGFVGVMELDNGYFLSVSPDKKRKYKTFQGALNFFNDGLYEGKIPTHPTSLNSLTA